METPKKFSENWMRRERGWWVKFYEILGVGFVAAGIVIAIGQFYDEPGQLPVPFILTGIACLLVLLVACAEGILVDLEYLQTMLKEGQTPDKEL